MKTAVACYDKLYNMSTQRYKFSVTNNRLLSRIVNLVQLTYHHGVVRNRLLLLLVGCSCPAAHVEW